MNKKRIFISALVGTIALAALSVSLTLAWYGASDRLGIRDLDVKVFSAANLKISTTKNVDDFKDELKQDDLKNEDGKNVVFTPVSSMFQDTWFNKEGKKDVPLFYDCSYTMVNSDGIPNLNAANANVDYFQKDLYLMTNLGDYFVGLDIDKCVFDVGDNYDRATLIYNRIHEKNPETDLSISKVQEMLDNLRNSLRVSILTTSESFYRYYIIDPTKDVDDVTYYGGLLDNEPSVAFSTIIFAISGFSKKYLFR